MRLTLILCLLLSTLTARASTVWYAITNWDGTLSTNSLRITPVGLPSSDGTFITSGYARLLSTTNGLATNTLAGGNYRLAIVGTPYTNIIFSVPTNDANTFPVTQLLQSGYNVFQYSPGVQQITSDDASITVSGGGKGIVNLRSVGGGGAATNLTPWSSDINAASHSLTNAGDIQSRGNISVGTNGPHYALMGRTTTYGTTNNNWARLWYNQEGATNEPQLLFGLESGYPYWPAPNFEFEHDSEIYFRWGPPNGSVDHTFMQINASWGTNWNTPYAPGSAIIGFQGRRFTVDPDQFGGAIQGGKFAIDYQTNGAFYMEFGGAATFGSNVTASGATIYDTAFLPDAGITLGDVAGRTRVYGTSTDFHFLNAANANAALYGDGANLVNLNASSLASGTVPIPVLPAAVRTNNAQDVSISYSRPGWQSQANPTYTGGDTNSWWKFGANASIPDFTLDYFPAGVFATRFMFTPEGPFVAKGFGDSASYPGSNVFTMPSLITNVGNYFAGNGVGLTSLNASSLASGTIPYAVLHPAVLTNYDTRAPVFDGSGITNLTLEFPTNAVVTGNGTATWDFSKRKSLLMTNAAVTISLANVAAATAGGRFLIISNSAASGTTIDIAFSGFHILTNGVPCSGIKATNLTAKNQKFIISAEHYGPVIIAAGINDYDP